MIVILGFGRSGTTWLSDIISKTLGQIVLFEPIHPLVMEREQSEKFSYATELSHQDSTELVAFYQRLMAGEIRKDWLLRNHTPVPSDLASTKIKNYIWDKCKICGVKEIRANFIPEWYIKNLGAMVFYIIRHPLPVIASIMRRSNFWEYGWPYTYELFMKKVADSYVLLDGLVDPIEDYEKYTLMYAITNRIIAQKAEEHNINLIRYEDLYEHPFEVTNDIIKIIFHNMKIEADIHPSFLFTPSLTTLKTVHGSQESEAQYKESGIKMFYDDVLDEKKISRILDICNSFDIKCDKMGWTSK